MKRRLTKPPIKQPMPDELLDSLLELVRVKFYQGHAVTFAKDRPRILAWVIFEPARWLRTRGVTISTENYGKLLKKVLLEAAAHGNLGQVRYLPAWLKQTIQSHLAMHGDEIYDDAKSIRNLVENALVITRERPERPYRDVVDEFTAADRLLKVAKRHKIPRHKQPVKQQLNLI